jgi:hypothetical protein
MSPALRWKNWPIFSNISQSISSSSSGVQGSFSPNFSWNAACSSSWQSTSERA